MDTFNSNSREGDEYPMPSLQVWLRNKSDASYSEEAAVRQNPLPPRQSVGIPMEETIGIRPSTRNLCLFPSNRTHWVAYNQVSPFLADAPKDRKGWANTSDPRFALRLNWVEWEVKAKAFTQQLTQESWKTNHSNPHIVYIGVPRE